MHLSSEAPPPRAASVIAVVIVAVAFPPLGRGVAADSPSLLAFGYSIAVAVTAGLARHSDPALGDLPWRRWLADTTRAAGVTLLLAGLRWVRGPIEEPIGSLRVFGSLLFGVCVEEVVFRGLLPAVLPRRAALLVSSLAFGAAHADTMIPHSVAGALFHLLRGRTGSLVAPILAHLAHNAAVIAAMK